MKTIKIFANCNPLKPHCFICVDDSGTHTCSVDSYEKEVLPDYIKKLKSLGYDCYAVINQAERISNIY